MKLRALFWLVVLSVLLNGCAVFFRPQADPCDVRFDAVLESTGDYRTAFDAYYACRNGENNGMD